LLAEQIPLKIAQNCSKSTQNVSKCLIPAPEIRSKLLKIAQNQLKMSQNVSK
jgi:hypothetical protein